MPRRYEDEDTSSYSRSPRESPGLPRIAKVGIVFALVALLFVLASGGLWETNRAGYVKICQMPVTGELKVIDEPGMFYQGFGEVTEYQQAGTYTFGRPHSNAASATDDSVMSDSIETRFNDGGTAKWSGNIRFELPIHNRAQMTRIHTQFRSYEHVAESLIGPSTRQSLILTSALMSSQDSYSGRKSEFPQLVEDQLLNGVFLTDSEEELVVDAQSGEQKKVRRVVIRKDNLGAAARRSNPMHEYDIRITQVFLDKEPVYEDGIITQIEKGREATMRIATARAQAEAAIQDEITAQSEGKVKVAKAEAEQNIEKIRAMVQAEQEKQVAELSARKKVAVAEQEKLEAETKARQLVSVAEQEKLKAEVEANQALSVAKLDRETAEQEKQSAILRAEGEAQARRLVLEADGALSAKIQAYLETQRTWASAFSAYRGSIVPTIVTGGSGSSQGSDFSSLMQIFAIRAAKDLALDTDIKALGK